MRQWFTIALSWSVVKRSLKVALVVGSLLAMINHGDAILSGVLTMAQVLKIVLSYLVPYGVSSFSSVQAIKGQSTPLK